MGKRKKRSYPNIEELLDRPWCYYCERDFEDLKLLISHQKAKHFKCDRCGRRLNTAGGLSVHLNQVHKETLSQVENALPNRQGLDVEIFGMEGIPADVLEQHRTRISQNFHQAQEDRRIATGNVQPSQRADGGGQSAPRSKLKIETAEEIKARLAVHRAKVRAHLAAGGDIETLNQPVQPAPSQPPIVSVAFPAAYQGITGMAGAPAIPSGLPQRPSYAPGSDSPSVHTGAFGTGHGGDDIDQLIRMAEAGIKPGGKAPDGQAPVEATKSKKDKDKNSRLVYNDPEDWSPEERMAMLPRYLFVSA